MRGWGGRSLSVSLPLCVSEATVHCRPRPPSTAAPLLCRRSVLVPLGRPLKRDSVTFRWNALGAHDSVEEEPRLRGAEREREKEQEEEEERSLYFMQVTSWSHSEEIDSSLPGEESNQSVRWHPGGRRSHFLTSQIPSVPPGGATSTPTGVG